MEVFTCSQGHTYGLHGLLQTSADDNCLKWKVAGYLSALFLVSFCGPSLSDCQHVWKFTEVTQNLVKYWDGGLTLRCHTESFLGFIINNNYSVIKSSLVNSQRSDQPPSSCRSWSRSLASGCWSCVGDALRWLGRRSRRTGCRTERRPRHSPQIQDLTSPLQTQTLHRYIYRLKFHQNKNCLTCSKLYLNVNQMVSACYQCLHQECLETLK